MFPRRTPPAASLALRVVGHDLKPVWKESWTLSRRILVLVVALALGAASGAAVAGPREEHITLRWLGTASGAFTMEPVRDGVQRSWFPVHRKQEASVLFLIGGGCPRAAITGSGVS